MSTGQPQSTIVTRKFKHEACEKCISNESQKLESLVSVDKMTQGVITRLDLASTNVQPELIWGNLDYAVNLATECLAYRREAESLATQYFTLLNDLKYRSAVRKEQERSADYSKQASEAYLHQFSGPQPQDLVETDHGWCTHHQIHASKQEVAPDGPTYNRIQAEHDRDLRFLEQFCTPGSALNYKDRYERVVELYSHSLQRLCEVCLALNSGIADRSDLSSNYMQGWMPLEFKASKSITLDTIVRWINQTTALFANAAQQVQVSVLPIMLGGNNQAVLTSHTAQTGTLTLGDSTPSVINTQIDASLARNDSSIEFLLTRGRLKGVSLSFTVQGDDTAQRYRLYQHAFLALIAPPFLDKDKQAISMETPLYGVGVREFYKGPLIEGKSAIGNWQIMLINQNNDPRVKLSDITQITLFLELEVFSR